MKKRKPFPQFLSSIATTSAVIRLLAATVALVAQHALVGELEPLLQGAYIKASHVDAGDSFGQAVAVDGNLMVIGAPSESSSATGINGDSTNNDANRSGAAYVFRRSGDSWVQEAYIKAHNTFGSDLFGSSVDISGARIVVGALGESAVVNGMRTSAYSGAAYIFVRRNGEWLQEAHLKAQDYQTGDQFGGSVAIDDKTVVIGAVRDDPHPSLADVALGSAFVFEQQEGIWTQVAKLSAQHRDYRDHFGWKVDVSDERIVVSAPFEQSAAIGVNGDQEDNSVLQSGAAYVFHKQDGIWVQEAYLKGNITVSMNFGYDVAIDRNTILVGAPREAGSAAGVNGDPSDQSLNGSGAAYVFRRTEGEWLQEAYLKASNPGGSSTMDIWGDLFGSSVAVNGDRVAVSAPFEDSGSVGINGDTGDADPDQGPDWTGGYSSGACYIFDRNEGSWTQTHYIKASNTGFFDGLGTNIALEEDWFVAGSFYESSSSIGVDGDQHDDSAFAAGAVYAFRPTSMQARWPSARLQHYQGNPDLAVLHFDTIPGSTYQILRSPDLQFDEASDLIFDNFQAFEFGKQTFFVDLSPPEESAFYQVKVKR